jgi:glycosyltransferase involved in cell wall biosynthesis
LSKRPLAHTGDAIHPKVTVFVPFYNRADYLGSTIESVLAQSFGDFELLLVDDGSTDGSREVIAGFGDRRIRVESNEQNLGIPRTRNRGLEFARGEYLALLDSDDIAHPKRLERQVQFLDRHTDYAEIGTWCGFIDERGRRLSRVKRHAIHPDDIRAEMLFRCPISNRSVMGRVAILREYPYRPEFPVCEDVDVHCRIGRDHLVGNLPEVLVYGREHAGRTSRLLGVERATLQAKVKRELLEDLGIKPSAEDLARHVAIGRRETGIKIDEAFLNWTDRWLAALFEANRSNRRYESGAFSRVLGFMWAATCWHGRAKLGVRLPLSLARTPWACRALEYAVHKNLRLLTRGDPV